MAMQIVGHGRYELMIRQEQNELNTGQVLLGFSVFHTYGKTFIKLNLQNHQNETFRLSGELIPTIVDGNQEILTVNDVCETEKDLRETIQKQAEELSRWRKYPTTGGSTSSMTLLDWLFYLGNEQIDDHTISALTDWLEEKGETVRLAEVKRHTIDWDQKLSHVLRNDLIYALLKV